MRTLFLYVSMFAALSALPAAAQGLGGTRPGPGAAGGGVASGTQDDRPKNLPPPDAVPGARPRADSVTPLKGGTADLAPTEALFDAINRGDILTARDAINRGADLDSTNLLGLTPIELSVDLGRNDISFLLLSLRGAAGASSRAANIQPGGGQPAPAPMTAAEKRAAARAARVAATPRPSPKIAEAASSTRLPTLFAGDGGAPAPSAGFLGFDHK